MYIVRGGDTLAMIAVRTGVDPARLMVINGLSDSEHIYEGQRLELEGRLAARRRRCAAGGAGAWPRIARTRPGAGRGRADAGPAVSAAQAQAQGPALLADAAPPASADPIDYSVDKRRPAWSWSPPRPSATTPTGSTCPRRACARSITCAARSAVLIGSHFKLAFTKVTRAQFEQRRRDYHQQLAVGVFRRAPHHRQRHLRGAARRLAVERDPARRACRCGCCSSTTRTSISRCCGPAP